jgi:predicted DNA-binding transcriptional regulator AlpA
VSVLNEADTMNEHNVKTAKVGKPHPAPAAALDQHYRYKDLKHLGIVGSWPTLYDWIKKRGFPEGTRVSSHFRIWSASEVHRWLESQQSDQAA